MWGCQREAAAPVRLEEHAQVDVGLTGPDLPLDGEVARVQRGGGGRLVAELDGFQVQEDLLSKEGEAAAETVFGKGERCLEVPRIAGTGELGAAGLLASRAGCRRLRSPGARLDSRWSCTKRLRRCLIPPSGRNPRNGESWPHSRSRWAHHRRAPPLQSCSRSRSHAAAPSR